MRWESLCGSGEIPEIHRLSFKVHAVIDSRLLKHFMNYLDVTLAPSRGVDEQIKWIMARAFLAIETKVICQ